MITIAANPFTAVAATVAGAIETIESGATNSAARVGARKLEGKV